MQKHLVYTCIVNAVKSGRLKETITKDDFRKVCPNFAEGTYNTFLWKHRAGNPGGNS